MIAEELVNPFRVEPQLEFPHPIQAVERWTEYCYFFAYDPQHNVGLSIHIGRLSGDLSIWRGILYVFLPDGDVLAHKYSGRDSGPQSFGAGPFRAKCVEPFCVWTLEFDGVLQRTNHSRLAHEIMRDARDEHVSFSLVLESAAPLYSVDIVAGGSDAKIKHYHHEQISRVRGEFVVNGQRITVEGVGARDHSSGPRDYRPLRGALWAQMLFPSGRAAHVAVVSRANSLTPGLHELSAARRGYVYWGDGEPLELVEVITAPPICTEETDLRSLPANVMENESLRSFDLVLGTSRGVQVLRAERLRAIASTYLPPSEEVAGTDLAEIEALQQSKTVMKITWNDEIGYGMSDNLVAIRCLKKKGFA